MINDLDIRDISIIDSLPVYDTDKSIVTVGAGKGRLEWWMCKFGYKVMATDLQRDVDWNDLGDQLQFTELDIIDPTMQHYMPSIFKADTVICSQVLEHIANWKFALKNLIEMAKLRVIITIPYGTSFCADDHVNFWDSTNIVKFHKIAASYTTSVMVIRTKPEDAQKNQWCYLIVIDKRQKY